MSEISAIYETKSGDYLIMAYYHDGTICDKGRAANLAEAVDMATVMRPAGGRVVVMRAVYVFAEQAAMTA